MALRPLYIPSTQLDLSLAECFLQGAGIPCLVLNRYAFGVFGLPPVSGFSDCRIFVAPEHFEDATALLADLVRDFAAFNMTPQQKLRVIVEGYFMHAFAAVRRTRQTVGDDVDFTDELTSSAPPPQS
jgi:Putative prokaryotic signal transducing protein